MKNQLFKVIPDKNITLSLLNLFGIHDFNDNHSFTKLNLIDLKTVDNGYHNQGMFRGLCDLAPNVKNIYK